MNENVQLEARVWGRIMGEKADDTYEKSEIAELLEQECEAAACYRRLLAQLPQHRHMVQRLLRCSENNIKMLKTMYFLEKGYCYKEKHCKNGGFCNVCQWLRSRYKLVENHVFLAENQQKSPVFDAKFLANRQAERKMLLCLLQCLL